MKLTKSKCRITGIQTGEAVFKALGGPNATLHVKFALLVESGDTAGYFEKGSSWSDRTKELLVQLMESLEADALPYVFEEPIQDAGLASDREDEPPQI